MKILIAGSSGMIGSAVTRYLTENGHEVFRLVRHTAGLNEVRWNPDAGEIDTAGLEGFDGVVHLASMPWPMRWTAKAKEKIRFNRLATNRLLAESLAACEHKPQVLICASGMGYYPSSGDTVLTEDSPAGTSFLARLQQEGEAATAPASKAGIRVVHLRIPPVVGGAALQRVGFQAGDGKQWESWVGRDELASIIEFALTTETLAGPVNAVSPNPLRNAEFATVSTQALGQKPGGTMPALIVRLVMGEMGEEFLLASRRIQPVKLLAAGYRFRFPELEEAVRHEMDIMKAGLASLAT
ncbi:MAG TPA: TIGR01777 family oxidoreductase [Anaerolineales bacterium]